MLARPGARGGGRRGGAGRARAGPRRARANSAPATTPTPRRRPCAASASGSVAPSASATDGGGLAGLSSREREIAELVAAGQRNREIADSLFLSVRTVEGHLARTFRKLEVSTRTQLAALVSAASEDPSES